MKERYFSTFQLILLTLFAVLIVVAKIALRLPLQLSGHSGIFWMAIIIVASRAVPRKGAASLVGLISGIIAAFIGLGDFGALNTLISYTAVGVGTDLALLLLGNPENLSGCCAGRNDWAFCKIPGEMGVRCDEWCPGWICGTGVSQSDDRLPCLWSYWRNPGWSYINCVEKSRIFCLYGREKIKII